MGGEGGKARIGGVELGKMRPCLRVSTPGDGESFDPYDSLRALMGVGAETAISISTSVRSGNGLFLSGGDRVLCRSLATA